MSVECVCMRVWGREKVCVCGGEMCVCVCIMCVGMYGGEMYRCVCACVCVC